ncbi:UNVERIFIED_CONTAM: hypothetical protein Sindi_1458400 [Sesamum indicum]
MSPEQLVKVTLEVEFGNLQLHRCLVVESSKEEGKGLLAEIQLAEADLAKEIGHEYVEQYISTFWEFDV